MLEKIKSRFMSFTLLLTLLFSTLLVILNIQAIPKIFHTASTHTNNYTWIRILITLPFILIMVVFFMWIQKYLTKKYAGLVLFGLIVVLQILYLIFVSHPSLTSDDAVVQNMALEMLSKHKGQIDTTNNYFQYYTNNHFFTVVMYYYYRVVTALGFQNMWIMSVIANIFMIDLSFVIAYFTGKRFVSVRLANLFLLFTVMSPTTYYWLTTTYTNTFSMPFLCGALYFALSLRHGTGKKAGLKLFLLSFCSVVGYMIRPTTIVPIIAIVFFFLCKTKWNKKAFIKAGSFVLVSVVLWSGCQALVRHHVDYDKITEQFPIHHWLMMGVNAESDGCYTLKDVSYTKKHKGIEAKKEADILKLKQRVKKNGFKGMVHLGAEKMLRVWAMSDVSANNKASYASDFPPLFHYFINRHNTWYIIYSNAFHILIYIFATIALFKRLRKKSQKDCEQSFIFLNAITFLGAILFFLIWEANMKYSICFFACYISLMADGATVVSNWLHQRLPKVKPFKLVNIATVVVCAIATVLLYIPLRNVEQEDPYTKIYEVRYQDCKPYTEFFGNAKVIEQNIMVGQTKDLNYFGIMFDKLPEVRNDIPQYHLEVLSNEDNSLIFQTNFTSKNIKGNSPSASISCHWNVTLNKTVKNNGKGYKLRFTRLVDQCTFYPIFNRLALANPYPYGSTFADGKEYPNNLGIYIFHKKI